MSAADIDLLRIGHSVTIAVIIVTIIVIVIVVIIAVVVVLRRYRIGIIRNIGSLCLYRNIRRIGNDRIHRHIRLLRHDRDGSVSAARLSHNRLLLLFLFGIRGKAKGAQRHQRRKNNCNQSGFLHAILLL